VSLNGDFLTEAETSLILIKSKMKEIVQAVAEEYMGALAEGLVMIMAAPRGNYELKKQRIN
jgi:hypothetical protein